MLEMSGSSPREQWSVGGYRGLLAVLARQVNVVSIDAYASGSEGVWLRHDVELDLSAAAAFAKVEADLSIAASYFVCPESPFLRGSEVQIRQMCRLLAKFGHDVSVHVKFEEDADSLLQKIEAISAFIGIARPSHVSFHAPGVSPSVLARAPLGANVYGAINQPWSSYYSDSTGRWLWGDPRVETLTGRATQLLTHPFWWAGNSSDLGQLLSVSALHRHFLPKYSAEPWEDA